MIELYFTIQVWTEVILATLFGILTIIYVVSKLIDHFRWKKISKKHDTFDKHP